MKIPNKISVGGQEINITEVDHLQNDNLGRCYIGAGFIKIANKVTEGLDQTESSKINTFYHELIHCILDTMGEHELSANEKFVSCFSGFLTEAMRNAYFKND